MADRSRGCRACAKDMTITIVMINSQAGMRLECGWHHAQKRWSWEFEDFEKSHLRLDHGGRELSFCHGGRELSFCHGGRELSSLPLRHVVGIFGSLPTEILNITRCAVHWDAVSIVRIVSLSACRRTEVRS